MFRVSGCGWNHTGALQPCCCVYRTKCEPNRKQCSSVVEQAIQICPDEGSTPSIAPAGRKAGVRLPLLMPEASVDDTKVSTEAPQRSRSPCTQVDEMESAARITLCSSMLARQGSVMKHLQKRSRQGGTSEEASFRTDERRVDRDDRAVGVG